MKQTLKKLLILLTLFLVVGFFLYQVQDKVLAEQSGSSPESGVTSRIKTIYESLVSLTHGSESAGSWGNWGVMWNRIRSAAEWVPSDTAVETDVASGKTFHNTSRTQKTGTASLAPDWSNQSLQDYDDCRGPDCAGSEDEDSMVEETIWTNTAGSATTGVWQDTRTGLYWSEWQANQWNNFSRPTCDFFTSLPRGSYAGGDSDCGSAINTCANLSLESVAGDGVSTDWYLPSQKEYMTAYIDGIFNTNYEFAGWTEFWTSTEVSDSNSSAMIVEPSRGVVGISGKMFNRAVRCVRRD